MTEQPRPAPPSTDDSRVSSVAWAVAVIVVALVVALIAWLALGDAGSDRAGAPSAPSASAPALGGGDDGTAGQPEERAEERPGAQEAPEEVRRAMLELQRRDPADLMAVGDVDAPVVMIEYADYRCPYCAQFALETRPGLQPLVDAGVLRIEFRDFVIIDEQSHAAAVAARAAARQGLLEPYQEAVFGRSAGGHADLARADLLAIAEEVEVPDLAAFEEALDDPALAAAVDADTAEARSIGLSSTPTFLVNTSIVQGARSLDLFETVVAQEEQRSVGMG